MRFVPALLITLVLSATARADLGAPSKQTLADMGLGSLQVISDAEAQAIRGAGFNPAKLLSGFAHYEQSKLEFRQRVQEFQERFDGRIFKGAASFQQHNANFQTNVNQFRAKVH